MNLSAVDLNLFLVLHAVLEERSARPIPVEAPLPPVDWAGPPADGQSPEEWSQTAESGPSVPA